MPFVLRTMLYAVNRCMCLQSSLIFSCRYITTSDFQNFFVYKIAAVRMSTNGATNPTFRPSLEDIVFNVLKPIDLDEVTSADLVSAEQALSH